MNQLNKFLFHSKLKYRLSRHIIFLIIIVLVFTLILYSRNPERHFVSMLVITLINAVFFIGYSYLMIYFLIPFYLPQKKYLFFILFFFIAGVVLSIVKLSISDYIFYSSISPEYLNSKGFVNVRFILINTKDMSFIVALFVIAKFTKDWLITEKQNKSLELKYTELRLRLLQSNFEPHFLFNTLNNLYALSFVNQQKMLEVIQHLSRLLEFSIKEAQKPLVPVLEELKMIEDFISIEQIRYGDRLRVENTVSGYFAQLEIAPLLLFTLVENCFKHGSSVDAGTPWIHLSMICENRRICYQAKNSIPQALYTNDLIREKGLQKLRQRLDLIYPKKYSLLLIEGAHEFTATLEVDLTQ